MKSTLNATFCLLLSCAAVSGLSQQQPSRAVLEYYGPALQFDVLNNESITTADVDYRFRAKASGPAQSVIWWDKYDGGTCDGYACGTGGAVNLCIYGDDGNDDHLAAGSALVCVIDASLRTGERIRSEQFPEGKPLRAGSLYHLVWHNIDPDPTRNYVSVDDVCVWREKKPRQPTVSDDDLAVLVGNKVVGTDTPIFQLTYRDGSTQGQGYKESWNYTSAEISGPARVRELVTVTGHERQVTAVSVRVNRTSGTLPLRITLSTADGTILEEGSIEATKFPIGARLGGNARASQFVIPEWGTMTFALPRILLPGKKYQLILSAAGDSVYQAYGIQRASAYGFSPFTFFADGRGEFSRDGGLTWSGFSQTAESTNHKDADLQFYFTVQTTAAHSALYAAKHARK